MGAAQIGLGESREDRSVLLTASEIDLAQEAAEQPRGVDLGAVIGDALESEARNRQRFAGLLRSLARRASRSRQNAVALSRPVSGSMTPSVSSDFSTRLSWLSNACRRTNGRIRSTRRTGSESTRTRLGSRSSSTAALSSTPIGRSRNRTSSASKVSSSCDYARTQPFADDHAVHVASVEIARRGLDAQRSDQADALADRDLKARDRSRRVRRTARLRPRADQAERMPGLPSSRPRCALGATPWHAACGSAAPNADEQSAGRWNRPSRSPARSVWRGRCHAPPARSQA